MRWRAGSVPEISRNLEKSQPGERSNWSWQPGSWEKALRPIKPKRVFSRLQTASATFLCHLSTVHQFCLKLTPLFVFTLILHPNHFKKEKFSPTFLRILEVCGVLFATLGTRRGTGAETSPSIESGSVTGYAPVCYWTTFLHVPEDFVKVNSTQFPARFWSGVECFHMTSRRPYWCSTTTIRRPCWCSKPVLWDLFLCKCLFLFQ